MSLVRCAKLCFLAVVILLSVLTLAYFSIDGDFTHEKRDVVNSASDSIEADATVTDQLQTSVTDSLKKSTEKQLTERQKEIVKMFQHAWKGYTQYAWGKDELFPISKQGRTTLGLGVTIIDSLDTMWLMGLKKEFNDARQWVEESLNITGNGRTVSVFETNIRVLGGLLAAYHLSNDQIFLQKAVELGDRLLIAFQTETGIPYGSVRLDQDMPIKTSDVACIAELGSLQLEFRDLSHSTGNNKYQRAADKALEVVQSHTTSGIATQEVFIKTGIPVKTNLIIGPRTDSYYEYLLKQWIQTKKTEDKFKKWYNRSVNAIMEKLIRYSTPNHLAYLVQLLLPSQPYHQMHHLACFLPGVLALGHLHGFPESHIRLAKNLTNTCYQFYQRSPSGLSSDVVQFVQGSTYNDFIPLFYRNEQRPETVESLFVLYRVTKDPIYREWGWKIAQAFEKHSRAAGGGYAVVSHIFKEETTKVDRMQSFFLSETLKYLFLLFSDDEELLPLGQWVFNTEAHPLPVF